MTQVILIHAHKELEQLNTLVEQLCTATQSNSMTRSDESLFTGKSPVISDRSSASLGSALKESGMPTWIGFKEISIGIETMRLSEALAPARTLQVVALRISLQQDPRRSEILDALIEYLIELRYGH